MPTGISAPFYFCEVITVDQFAFSGFSATNMMMCVADGADVYQTDYAGNRQLIGKTLSAYNELEQTTTEYYNKLVELGVIVPPKSQEELMAEMQKSMLEMSGIIASLSGEIKELKENGSQRCACGGGEDVPKREPKRGGAKGAGGDSGDGQQP